MRTARLIFVLSLMACALAGCASPAAPRTDARMQPELDPQARERHLHGLRAQLASSEAELEKTLAETADAVAECNRAQAEINADRTVLQEAATQRDDEPARTKIAERFAAGDIDNAFAQVVAKCEDPARARYYAEGNCRPRSAASILSRTIDAREVALEEQCGPLQERIMRARMTVERAATTLERETADPGSTLP